MEEILKMIESVDPSDTAKLDEIDARVWCFSQNEEYAGKTGQFYYYKNKTTPELVPNFRISPGTGDWPDIPQYTRSRDALKAIRPSSGNVLITSNKQGTKWSAMIHHGYENRTEPNDLPTEELAELHAIIQAINHERKESDNERE